MKVSAHRITGSQVVVSGDYLKVRGNEKLTPVVLLIGYTVSEIEQIAGEDLEGIYRPAEGVKS